MRKKENICLKLYKTDFMKLSYVRKKNTYYLIINKVRIIF